MSQIRTWSSGAANPTSGRAAPGTIIGGRYALRAAVGHGGMGTVWRANDLLLRRDVAVKEVILPAGLAPSDRDALYERTMREARAAASLQHPSVIQVYDVVTEDGRPWIVMELLDARSLADMIIEDGPLAPRAVAKIGIALLGALEVAHANGVLHRDVKPANVLICSDGRCVLTDFGVARLPTEAQLTTPGMVLGSPHFISPERAMGRDFGPPSDLFSLGVTLYTAVEGQPPFDRGDPIETMHAVVEDPPRPPVRSGPLTGVIMGLLEKDPARRYDIPTARAMLRELLAGPLASTAPVGLVSDPYAVVTPRPTAPPAVLPRPTGQVGGRAMIPPGQSITDRLRELRARSASSTPASATTTDADTPTGLMPSVATTGAGEETPTSALATPPSADLPTSAMPKPSLAAETTAASRVTDAPTGRIATSPWTASRHSWQASTTTRGDTVGAKIDRALATARSAATRAVTAVKRWPRHIQLAAIGGVAVVLVLGAVMLTGETAPETATLTVVPPSTEASSAPPFAVRTHNERGVAVNVPRDWERRAGGVYVDYVDPAGTGRRVRVLVEPATAEPKRFLQIAEAQLKKNPRSCAPPYQRIALNDAELAGKPAAELEYTCGSGDDKRHGLWRAIVEGGKAYSFYLFTPEESFEESKPIYNEMVRTFRVTGTS